MGLPVSGPGGGLGRLGEGSRDPRFAARLREILGEGPEEPDGSMSPLPSSAKALPSAPPRRWPAEAKEGAFDPRPAAAGDYSSPVMWTVLMGAKPAPGPDGGAARFKAAGSSLLPPSAAPFLRTIVPNYPRELPGSGDGAAAGLGSLSARLSGRSPQPPPSVAHLQQRLAQGSAPSAQLLREQLCALPLAYRCDVPQTPV